MSHATPAATGSNGRAPAADGRTVDADADVQRVLEALEDPDCRAILGATADEALSASEVADACDIPLSTTYRKLERLADADLLAEGLRLRRSGKHTTEYVRRVDDVVVSVGPNDGVELRVSEREASDRPFASAGRGFASD